MQDLAIKDRPFADQKTAILPLKHAYTGQADIDAKLDELKAELVETYGKSALQGSLAPKKLTNLLLLIFTLLTLS